MPSRPFWVFSGCVVVLVLVGILLINFVTFPTSQLPRSDSNVALNHPQSYECKNSGSLVLFDLRTSMGVSYDASHWFHMAENFMARHSTLRHSNQQASPAVVFYCFDQERFSDRLNGVTKFMTMLGTLTPNVKPILSYFGSCSGVDGLRLHDHVPLTKITLSNGQFEDFSSMQSSFISSKNFQSGTVQEFLNFAKSSIPRSAFSVVNDSCLKFGGTVGGQWPTPQRGHWFPYEGDITSFREKIELFCPFPSKLKSSNSSHRKMIIYQRDLSRKIDSLNFSLSLLKHKLDSSIWSIEVLMHVPDRSPCELAHKLHDVDVLITSHGFQSMLLLFLPRPSLIFEVFPFKYFKRGYGPFGNEYGLHHGGVMSPAITYWSYFPLSFLSTKWCMSDKFCRGRARSDDVRLTQHGVDVLMEKIIELERDPEFIKKDELYSRQKDKKIVI